VVGGLEGSGIRVDFSFGPYCVCRNRSGRYAIREVLYEHDGRLISYGKHPVAPLAASLADLSQLVEWYRDALDAPAIFLEAVNSIDYS